MGNRDEWKHCALCSITYQKCSTTEESQDIQVTKQPFEIRWLVSVLDATFCIWNLLELLRDDARRTVISTYRLIIVSAYQYTNGNSSIPYSSSSRPDSTMSNAISRRRFSSTRETFVKDAVWSAFVTLRLVLSFGREAYKPYLADQS